MNIAPGKIGDKDIHGQEINADGAHGHLYMYYQPPTKNKPGAILVGLEGTEPGVKGELGEHSLVGAPDKLSPFGGKQWNGSAVLDGESKGKVDIYNKYSGITVNLRDPGKLSALYETKTSDIPDNIGSMVPEKDMQSLKETIKNQKLHTKDTIINGKTSQKDHVALPKVKSTSFMKLYLLSGAVSSAILNIPLRLFTKNGAGRNENCY